MGADDDLRFGSGRDRGVARKHAFLAAAREVFLEQGYVAASVNEIVRRAGGSLATLYAQYGSKAGIFEAVMYDQHERFTKAMAPSSVDHLELEAGLQSIGEHFLRALLERDNLAMFRIIFAEGRKFPEDVRRYISSGGADKVVSVVVEFLKLRAPDVAEPELAASYLLELWRSRHHYRALADNTYTLSDAELSRHITAGLAVFLHGVRRVGA